jgi:hypothetical protein
MLEAKGRPWVNAIGAVPPAPALRGARRAVTLVIILALPFSYTGVGALVPAGVPQRLFVVTAIWAVLGIAGHAACPRNARVAGRRSLGFARRVAAGAAGHGGGGGCHRRHADLGRITVAGVAGSGIALLRTLQWRTP